MAGRLPIRFLKRYLQTSKEAPQPRRRYGREEYLGMLRSRTTRGARLLDRECPGWWERIEVGRLGLASCPLCVMGQSLATTSKALPVWRYGVGDTSTVSRCLPSRVS